jgi:hypothetical protein
MTATRRFDGLPETDADRRFFDLREAGWTGPIDHNGYADTESEAAEILRDIARRRGERPTW